MRFRMLALSLAVAVLLSVVAPAFNPPPARAFGLLTVGALLVTAKIAKDLVSDVIKEAEQSVKNVLEDFQNQLSDLIAQVESTYGSALDTTLDSLDAFTAQQFSRLGGLLDDLNQKFLAGIGAIEQTTLNLIREATQVIGQVLSQLEDLIVVGIKGATFVIDKATYNAVFIISMIFLAIGLLFFVGRVWKGLPTGKLARGLALGFMAIYLGVFGALLAPSVRVYAITMAGQAEKLEAIGSGPRIFTVTPRKLITTASMDLTVTGSGFDTGAAPKVTVGGKDVTPTAWGDSFVALKLSGTAFTALSGNQPIVITASDTRSASTLIEFVKPLPPPEVLSWRMVPTGKRLEVQKFPATYVECVSLWDSKRTVDRSITVPEGWTLAIDPAYTGRVQSFPGSYPNPAVGYDENPISFNGRDGKARRDIFYFPEGSQRKTGIRVKGECDGSHFFLDQWRTWWKAEYSLWGKREVAHEGASHQGTACPATGTRSCATYPAANLAPFVDKRPEAYKVWITLRTPSGKTEEHFKVLRPGIPEDRITSESVALWVENNQLMLRGPMPPKPIWDKIIIKPLPLKPLPILKP